MRMRGPCSGTGIQAAGRNAKSVPQRRRPDFPGIQCSEPRETMTAARDISGPVSMPHAALLPAVRATLSSVAGQRATLPALTIAALAPAQIIDYHQHLYSPVAGPIAVPGWKGVNRRRTHPPDGRSERPSRRRPLNGVLPRESTQAAPSPTSARPSATTMTGPAPKSQGTPTA
jgi:hypothetical protein